MRGRVSALATGMPRKATGQPNGKPPFKPTDDERKTVELMISVGIPHEGVALVLRDGISDKTLRKHFRREIDTAAIKANAKVGGTMFQQAIGGNMSAAIWWSKARMNWKETQINELSGALHITHIKREIVRPKD